MPESIASAVAAMGPGALTEAALVRHVHPLFSAALEQGDDIYLLNHSLGRPLDQTARDLQEFVHSWQRRLEDAWQDWIAEREAFRTRIAQLIGAGSGNSVIPRASAGQGLRAVLNCFERPLFVLTSCDEFISVNHVLETYRERDHVRLEQVEPGPRGYQAAAIVEALRPKHDLLVLSGVFYTTGQYLDELHDVVVHAREMGILVMLDLYHVVGAMPVDVVALDCDFAIGGSYKYLRGGPGAGWLYVHPRHLDGSLRTLDSGWFAQEDPLAFRSGEMPVLAPGGNAFFEGTPEIAPLYQARAGQQLALALEPRRLRAYSLAQLECLATELENAGVPVKRPETHGAFLTLPGADEHTQSRLRAVGIHADVRRGRLRLCPDILNTGEELGRAAETVARVLHPATARISGEA